MSRRPQKGFGVTEEQGGARMAREAEAGQVQSQVSVCPAG